ncbi:MAG: hypothetical protein NVS3B21_30400 [Acidimicrobiales bacterium]
MADGVIRYGLSSAYVRPCLLLLLADGSSHGYDLLEQVRGLGVSSADTGGVYRCLRTLEQEGLVGSWWEPSPSGPARRTYEITALGRNALGEAIRQIADTRRVLGGLVERYEGRRVGLVP